MGSERRPRPKSSPRDPLSDEYTCLRPTNPDTRIGQNSRCQCPLCDGLQTVLLEGTPAALGRKQTFTAPLMNYRSGSILGLADVSWTAPASVG